MDNFDDVYGFIEKFKSTKSEAEVLNILREVARNAGYEYFIVSALPQRGVKLKPFVLIEDWPPEWFARYTERDYVEVDPVARHCFETLQPFDWDSAPYDRDGSPADRLMNEATEFGLKAGHCVPVHTEDGMQGCVSFGGQFKDLDPKHKIPLHLLSYYAHGQLRLFRRCPRLKSGVGLTPSEREVLKLVASGKTSQDIADIRMSSKRTVDFHVVQAQRKLGTVSRAHSVAEAIRYNLISL